MYDRITLRECGSTPAFVRSIVGRCMEAADGLFYERLYQGLKEASRLPEAVRTRNQCDGTDFTRRRWASELLTSMQAVITGSTGAHCHAVGAEAKGYIRGDIRAMHAAAIVTVFNHGHYRMRIMNAERNNPTSAAKIVFECFDQFEDYLNNKVRTRDKVNRALLGHELRPLKVEVPEELSAAYVAQGTSDNGVINFKEMYQVNPELLCSPGNRLPEFTTVGFEQRCLTARNLELMKAEIKARASKSDIYKSLADQLGCSRSEAKRRYFTALYTAGLPVPPLDAVTPAILSDTISTVTGNNEVSLTKLGDSNMYSNTAPQVQQPVAIPSYLPFNTSRKAVESITHVYGVPANELTLERLTTILTDRQGEVDRLKAIPHKPEAIKQRIAELKQEIKEVLALTNDLFPAKAE